MAWGDPGVTEQQLVQENAIAHPGDNGGVKTVTLQRAGYLKRLRMYLQMTINQSAATGAPSKSAKGPAGAAIKRLRIEAAGRQPLYVMSGLGATIYNEMQNRDGSTLAIPPYQTEHNVPEGKSLVEYTAPTTGATAYTVRYPLEFLFAVPVFVRGLASELGLWLLQDRSVDLGVEVEFNPIIDASGANADRLYSGGSGLAATVDTAASQIEMERELYAVPQRQKDRPPEMWAHQVIEYEEPISGGFSRFDIPAAGMILRATIITLDSAGAVVEWEDVDSMDLIYGTNTTPIRRPGWAMAQEFVQDYGRNAAKGVTVLDFYKWGQETLKLAKDSEKLANFRLETNYSSTSSGKQLIILDTLQRVIRQPSQGG